MTHRAVVIALIGLAQASCVDFGYRLPDPEGFVPDAGPVVDSNPSSPDSGCVEGPTAPSNAGPQVSIITLSVDLPVLAVTVGDVVTWTNNDATDKHTVTAGAPGAILPPNLGGFDSGDLVAGQQFAYRFCTARTAVYFCQTHPVMMNNYRVVVGE